jgi:hypothetical protein
MPPAYNMGVAYPGVTAIPYSRFGVIINIVFKKDNSTSKKVIKIPQYTCPNFIKMSSMVLGKKKTWV